METKEREQKILSKGNGAVFVPVMLLIMVFGVSIVYGATAPGAPTNVRAFIGTTGNGVIEFTPPASDGGSPITGYTVTSNPGNITATGTITYNRIAVSGLAFGTVYTFTVKATNAIGTGPASAPSNSIDVPGVPTNITVTPSDRGALVSFTAPVSASPIVEYKVNTNIAMFTIGTASPLLVQGLTNGTQYTITVRAKNSSGYGPASASFSVTPVGPPGVPSNVTATPGDGQAKVSFSQVTAPYDGGSPVTSYTVYSSPGNKTATGTASPITVTGLTNGTSYIFQVVANNSAGPGYLSAQSNSVYPGSVPGAPTNVTSTPGNGQAIVSFTAPISHWNAITGYTVYKYTSGGLQVSGTASGTASPVTVTGLTNGTVYKFKVKATNAVGTGPASEYSNTVTPAK